MLSRVREGISVDNYVIMPNHVHMILRLGDDEPQGGAAATRLAISRFKRAVTLKAEFSPWQKSFQDHAIRDKDEYWNISHHIDCNPAQMY
jgi:REP element-mobilizing transposase RayT